MSRPISLVEREIETKIDAALKAEIAKGKKPSDMGVRDFDSIAVGMRTAFSPAAYDALVREGLEHIVKFVLGGMIAEVVWADGTGWPTSAAEILSASKRVLIDGKPTKAASEEDAIECFRVFREGLTDLTRHEFHEQCSQPTVERFRPLFIGQPDNRTIGEVAVMKAAMGDRLAMSFLAWRPL